MKVHDSKSGWAMLTGPRPWSPYKVGLVFLVTGAVVLVSMIFKAPITTLLTPGETITAEFASNYQIVAHETKVELAGLGVGVVSDVEHTSGGTVLVSMKVEDSTLGALGSNPSATVAPNTMLGGNYTVQLEPGGDSGVFAHDMIPLPRTKLPVELDRILEAFPRPTRQSLQGLTRGFQAMLARGGRPALRELVTHAPDTLRPAAGVLKAMQGTRPGVDLPMLVTHLQSMAHSLSANDEQLGDIVDSLDRTTAVLATHSRPLARGMAALPSTLRASNTGMTALRGTLRRLTVTAGSFRPAAREMAPLLRQLDPVLVRALPVMRDLRALMSDAHPLVEQLVPLTRRGITVLENVRGPVLNRVNGPIAETVMGTWRGTGPYQHSGGGIQADHRFYQELAYLVTGLDRASMTQDAQGSTLGLQVGGNSRSVVGTPLSWPNLLKEMQKTAGGTR